MQIGSAPLLDGKAAVADAGTAEPAEASGVPTRSAIEPLSWAIFVVCHVTAVAVLCCYGGTMNFSTSYAREDEVQLYKTATLMVIPGLLMEFSHAMSREEAADLSFPVVILEFILKLVVYATCWLGNGFIVHLNHHKSAQLNPVYTLRWLDWAVAVPSLSAVSLSTFATSEVPLGFRRLAPALAHCSAFVTTAWVGQITPNPTAGLVLTLMSGMCWMVYNVEQVMIILERSHVTPNFTFKIWCMIGKNIVYASYGATMLFDNYGLLSSLQVQTFYTYSDVIFKSMQVSLNCVSKNWDSQLERKTLSIKATLAERDITRLIGNASAPMVCVSQEGIVLGWNSKMEKATKISVEEARGKLFTDVTDPICHSLLKQAWHAACSDDGNSNDDNSNIVPVVFSSPERPGAPSARISMNFVARLGGTHSQTMVGVGQDMTELLNSQEMLERRSRSTAIVSHELKSPLAGIIGICKLLAGEMMQEGHKRYTSMILGCSERMLDLINNIMSQASLEHSPTMKAPSPKRLPVNLLDVIDEVIYMSQAMVDKSGMPLIGPDVQLINTTMDKLPWVSGDGNKFTQLFYNLITNALKFTRNGHVKVSVVTCSGELKVDVSDTGCGIEPHLLPHIFEPHVQGAPGGAGSFQGIGLGLSVAKGIAESHGGKISVKSQLNIGSTFTVTLPCGDELATRRWPRGQTSELKTLSQASLGPLVGQKPLILSVDDDDVNQYVIENNFRHEYDIEKAMDGYEVLEYLKSGKRAPCLILLDIMMPGMDGWQVVSSIRTDLGLGPSELPVLMLSARSHCERTKELCASFGANDFMQKPFKIKELSEKMRSLRGLQDNVADSKEPTSEETPSSLEVAATNHEVSRLKVELEEARAEARAEADRLRVQLREEAEVEERARRKAEAEVERLRAQLGREEAGEELARLRAEVSSLSQARGGAEAELERLRQQLDEEVATRQRWEHEASQARHESPQLPEPACEGLPAREATWLRQEMRKAQDDMYAMAKELIAHKVEAEMQRKLAESKKGENDFLKSELDLLRQQADLGVRGTLASQVTRESAG